MNKGVLHWQWKSIRSFCFRYHIEDVTPSILQVQTVLNLVDMQVPILSHRVVSCQNALNLHQDRPHSLNSGVAVANIPCHREGTRLSGCASKGTGINH